MSVIQKIKQLFMPSYNEFFNKYVSYFPTIGKQLKMGRNGSVLVIDKNTKQTATYKNWDELNEIYGLFPRQSSSPVVEEKPIQVKSTPGSIIRLQKIWTFGHPTRFNEIQKAFCRYYGLDEKTLIVGNFNKPNWVYYLDSTNSLVATNNTMVIDLLKNSSDWEEYKLPEPKRFTKADIAGMIGMDVDAFVIV